MTIILLIFITILLLTAIGLAWRYHEARQGLNEQDRLIKSLNLQLSTSNFERARLATVLDQMTDGVLIVDSQGRIQFANPAAQRLFEFADPIHRTITEVVRHYQLVEAWRRSRHTNELQTETIVTAAVLEAIGKYVVAVQSTEHPEVP